MQKPKYKLKTYEDFELAFIKKYRSDDFKDDTIEKIDIEIKNRELTQYDINDLIIKKLFENIDANETKVRCPRCKSLKVSRQEKGVKSVHHRELLTSHYFEGKSLDYIFYKCNVCGQDINVSEENSKVVTKTNITTSNQQ